MNGPTINYEQLAKEALRSVVKTVLSNVLKDGLPGDHHFYISFHTTAPGVKISSRISAQYPKEMTIVLQHQFWDLKVEDEHFEVRLSFSNIPELLIIPYTAVKVFFDPSVPYGLQFDQSAKPETVEDQSNFLDDNWHIPTENSGQDLQDTGQTRTTPLNDKQEKGSDSIDITTPTAAPDNISVYEPEPGQSSKDTNSEKDSKTDSENPDIKDDNPDGDSAQIVSLDAFRKK